MVRLFVLFGCLGALCFAGCSGANERCDSSACSNGCCGADGQCVMPANQTNAQCGVFGNACNACTVDQLCSSGLCVARGISFGTGGSSGTGGSAASETCTASSCPYGCCQNGACVSSNAVEDARCGRAKACVNCAAAGLICVADEYCGNPRRDAGVNTVGVIGTN